MFAPRYKRNRRFSGQTIAEAPVVLYTLFFFLAFPMLGMATTLFRSVLFYYSVRQAVNKAARSTTFTLAQSNAATVFANDTWYATSGTLTLRIVTQKISTGVNSYSTTKLPFGSIDTSANIYFIQGIGVGQITPLISLGSALGPGAAIIPGLTGPYTFTTNAQSYSEYPQGLWQ